MESNDRRTMRMGHAALGGQIMSHASNNALMAKEPSGRITFSLDTTDDHKNCVMNWSFDTDVCINYLKGTAISWGMELTATKSIRHS